MRKIIVICLALLVLGMSTAMAAEDMTLNVMLPDFYSDSDWVTLEAGNPVLQEIGRAHV